MLLIFYGKLVVVNFLGVVITSDLEVLIVIYWLHSSIGPVILIVVRLSLIEMWSARKQIR